MDAVMKAPLTAEDYQRADKVMLLLMQPQVKSLLDATCAPDPHLRPGSSEPAHWPKRSLTLPTFPLLPCPEFALPCVLH